MTIAAREWADTRAEDADLGSCLLVTQHTEMDVPLKTNNVAVAIDN